MTGQDNSFVVQLIWPSFLGICLSDLHRKKKSLVVTCKAFSAVEAAWMTNIC